MVKSADLVARFIGRPVILPEIIRELGNVRFNGTLSGYLDDLVADGLFSTSIGSIDTDLQLSFDETFSRLAYNGKVVARDLQLNRLLGENSQLGTASFQLTSSGAWHKGVGIEGNAIGLLSEIVYRGYTYRNIKADGRITPSYFEGILDVADPNLRLNTEGRFVYRSSELLGPSRDLNLKMKIENVDLAALHFMNPKNGVVLSGDVDVRYKAGREKDNTHLDVQADRLTVTSPKRQYRFRDLRVEHASNGQNDYTICSPIWDMSKCKAITTSPQSYMVFVA